MTSKKIEIVGFECNSVPFLIRQSMAGPSVLAEIVGTHPSPFPAGSGNGGREMAWRVVATVLSTVLVLADTLLVVLTSMGDVRPARTSFRIVFPSCELSFGGVVVLRPIDEVLSHPGPIATARARAEAWSIGHVGPCELVFDR